MVTRKRHAPMACLFAALIMVGPGVAGADEPVKTNLQVAKELTSAVIDELLASIPDNVDADEVWVASARSDERYQFVFNVLTGTLTARGVKTHDRLGYMAADTSGANPGLKAMGDEVWLEFEVQDFDLEYTKIYRKFLIGGKRVKRRADVSLLAKLVDSSDGLVLWQGEASRTYADQFAYSQISEVEAGLHEFSKPPREGRSWGKVVEPIAVSAIIVGLIYLFFSNQSGD